MSLQSDALRRARWVDLRPAAAGECYNYGANAECVGANLGIVIDVFIMCWFPKSRVLPDRRRGSTCRRCLKVVDRMPMIRL
jgi:hypothetical protein